MKFLGILEKAWLAAIGFALLMGTYNLATLRNMSYRVYFPFMCAGFCLLIYMNIRGQRRFLDKMKEENKDKASQQGEKDDIQPKED